MPETPCTPCRKPLLRAIRPVALALIAITLWCADAVSRTLGLIPQQWQTVASLASIAGMFTFCVGVVLCLSRRHAREISGYAGMIITERQQTDYECLADAEHAYARRRLAALSRALTMIHAATGRDIPEDLLPELTLIAGSR